jgi:hypothetical protein
LPTFWRRECYARDDGDKAGYRAGKAKMAEGAVEYSRDASAVRLWREKPRCKTVVMKPRLALPGATLDPEIFNAKS